LADANFPVSSICKCGPMEIRADSVRIPELLESILKLFPLDSYVDCPAAVMDLVESDRQRGMVVPVWSCYTGLLVQAGSGGDVEKLERSAFYERSKKAFAVVATG
ncbi:fucose mutarotase isoform X1, partial [Clarias magur]